MIAESMSGNRGAQDAGGKTRSRLRSGGVIPFRHRSESRTAPPCDDRRRPRNGRRPGSARGPTGPPDLAATARDAVVRYLQDASDSTADLKLAPGTPIAPVNSGTTDGTAEPAVIAEAVAAPVSSLEPGSGAVAGNQPPYSDADAQSVALRAAAAGVATLDKIEAMAAKLETDIAAALQAQAELQAGAGAAAEAAIAAAQAAWQSAGTAVAAEHRVRDSLRVISRQLVFTAVLALVAIIILALFAASAR